MQDKYHSSQLLITSKKQRRLLVYRALVGRIRPSCGCLPEIAECSCPTSSCVCELELEFCRCQLPFDESEKILKAWGEILHELDPANYFEPSKLDDNPIITLDRDQRIEHMSLRVQTGRCIWHPKDLGVNHTKNGEVCEVGKSGKPVRKGVGQVNNTRYQARYAKDQTARHSVHR